MTRTKYTQEQILAVLKEAEAGAAVADLIRKHGWACRFLGAGRSSQRYRGHRMQPSGLQERLTELAAARPRWGYRRLWVLLRREGYAVNWKRVYRLYREAGLAVKRRRRKRAAVARRPLPPATRPNERWSMDFVHDRLINGASLGPYHRRRQRAGVRWPGARCVGLPPRHHARLHPTGEADAERLRRELQQPAPRRMLERPLISRSCTK